MLPSSKGVWLLIVCVVFASSCAQIEKSDMTHDTGLDAKGEFRWGGKSAVSDGTDWLYRRRTPESVWEKQTTVYFVVESSVTHVRQLEQLLGRKASDSICFPRPAGEFGSSERFGCKIDVYEIPPAADLNERSSISVTSYDFAPILSQPRSLASFSRGLYVQRFGVSHNGWGLYNDIDQGVFRADLSGIAAMLNQPLEDIYLIFPPPSWSTVIVNSALLKMIGDGQVFNYIESSREFTKIRASVLMKQAN